MVPSGLLSIFIHFSDEEAESRSQSVVHSKPSECLLQDVNTGSQGRGVIGDVADRG